MESTKFLRIEGKEAAIVEQRILKKVSSLELAEGIMKLASKETPVLPSGCVFYKVDDKGQNELFVMERPPGITRIPYGIKTDRNIFKRDAENIGEYYDFDVSPILDAVDKGKGLSFSIMMPPTYLVLTRVVEKGTITGVYGFCSPKKPIESFDDPVYKITYPNISGDFREFCLGSTPAVTLDTSPLQIKEYVSRFMSSNFNCDYAISTPYFVSREIDTLVEEGKVENANDTIMVVWHILSQDAANLKKFTHLSEYKKLGTFREYIDQISPSSGGGEF